VGRGDVGDDGGELATRTGATTATRGHHADGGYTTRLTKIPAFAVAKVPPPMAVLPTAVRGYNQCNTRSAGAYGFTYSGSAWVANTLEYPGAPALKELQSVV
jgi:hypothetical protein